MEAEVSEVVGAAYGERKGVACSSGCYALVRVFREARRTCESQVDVPVRSFESLGGTTAKVGEILVAPIGFRFLATRKTPLPLLNRVALVVLLRSVDVFVPFASADLSLDRGFDEERFVMQRRLIVELRNQVS